MKNLVMTISIMNKFFAISHDDEANSLVAIGLDENKHFYPVVSEEELKLINQVIDKNIRKVYFELGVVSFEGKDYIQFQNRYDSRTYFALAEDEEKKILDYSGNERLYDYYNPKNVIFISSRNGRRSKSNRNHRKAHTEQNNRTSDVDSNNDYTPRNRRKKSNNIGLRVAIATGCIAGVAFITWEGLKLLGGVDLPSVTGNNQAIVVEVENEEYGIYKTDVEPIEDKKLTEEQLELKDKYDRYKEGLETQGFKPWEIAIILSEIKQDEYVNRYWNDKNAEHDKISFYYDSEIDSVVYVYDDVDRFNLKDFIYAEDEGQYDYESLSDEVKALVDAVNTNPNLSENHKKVIIDKFSKIWQKNVQYYLKDGGHYYDRLLEVLNTLIIEIKPQAGGNGERGYGNSHSGTAGGHYDRNKNKITEYGDRNSTTRHETGHAIGEFELSYTMLNEGYNEWKNGDNDTYDNERYMAFAFEEVFGEDTLAEAYARHGLVKILTDKLVEKAGIERDEAEKMIRELLADTQSTLFDLGVLYGQNKDTALENEEINARLDEILNTLEDINSKLGNSKNLKLTAIHDYFTNNKDSKFLQFEGEKILSFTPLENGGMLVKIGNKKDISYYGGEMIDYTTGRYKFVTKDLVLGQVDTINDYELDYANNHKFDTSSQESKDGLEDCMADPQMNTSIVQRIIEKFRKLFHHDKDDQQK